MSTPGEHFDRRDFLKHRKWETVRWQIKAMLRKEGMADPVCPECRQPMELAIVIILRPSHTLGIPANPSPAWHCRHCWGKG